MLKQRKFSKPAKLFCLTLVFLLLLSMMTMYVGARGGNRTVTSFSYNGSYPDGAFSPARPKWDDSATYVANLSDCALDFGVFGSSVSSSYGRECTEIRAYVYPDEFGYVPNTVYPTYTYARVCCWPDDSNYHSIYVNWSPDSEFYW